MTTSKQRIMMLTSRVTSGLLRRGGGRVAKIVPRKKLQTGIPVYIILYAKKIVGIPPEG